MNEKANFDDNYEIYLFTETQNETTYSKLNEFISYLKYNRVNLFYKFSYVGRGDGLIPDLTINENILMDFSPNSLTADRENQFQEYLKEQPNRHLENLYKKIITPHQLTYQTNSQMKKIATLIKSLIFEGQFIFLEEPEKLLDEESLLLFTEALKEQIERHKINVFIFSNRTELWMEHVQHQVLRQKDYSFQTNQTNKNNILLHTTKKHQNKKLAA